MGAIKYLNELNDSEVTDRNMVLTSQERALEDCVKRLDNLVKLKISSQNSDGSLLSNEEFKAQKESIIKEKHQIDTNMANTGQRIENWIETAEQAFDFAIHARYSFATGSLAEKRDIINYWFEPNFKGRNFALQSPTALLFYRTDRFSGADNIVRVRT